MSQSDEYRKWEDLPKFRHEEQARLLVDLLREYFKIEVKYCKTVHGLYAVEVRPQDDWRLQVIIEAFIVGWGRGYEQGHIMAVVDKS